MNCPACEADMDLDVEQLQEGGVVHCEDCGAKSEVVNLHPLELEALHSEDEEDDDVDDDLDDEDDEDFDDEDDDEDEDDGYDDDDDDFDQDDDADEDDE